MEEMRPVTMYFNSGLRLHFAICVATDVGPAVNDDHAHPEPLGTLLGDGEAEDPRTNHDEIRVHLHPPERRPTNMPASYGLDRGPLAIPSANHVQDWHQSRH